MDTLILCPTVVMMHSGWLSGTMHTACGCMSAEIRTYAYISCRRRLIFKEKVHFPHACNINNMYACHNVFYNNHES